MESFIKEEVWKDIEGFEGTYSVSSFGRVRNKKTGTMRKLCEDGAGYLIVTFAKNKRKRTYKVHRLVLDAFVPNPYNYPCVNHKDENKTNNHVSNLEWCSYKYNTNYGTAIARRSEKVSIPIEQLDLEGNLIAEFKSATEAQRQTGINEAGIRYCCKGKVIATFKGFVWRYKNESLRPPTTVLRQKKPIVQIDLQTNDIVQYWSCAKEAATIGGFCQSSVTACCRGRAQTAGGYKWQYK